jgi:hypothetical protein
MTPRSEDGSGAGDEFSFASSVTNAIAAGAGRTDKELIK